VVMIRCTRVVGCMHRPDHGGACETYDLSWVGVAVGSRLDELGMSQYGVRRQGRSDPAYTRAILETMQ
jgi:hypothetical protein